MAKKNDDEDPPLFDQKAIEEHDKKFEEENGTGGTYGGADGH